MLLFSTYNYQSAPSTTTMASPPFNGARPKGLWKVRGTQHPRLANSLTTTIVVNTTTTTSNVGSKKKQNNCSSGDVSDSSSTSSKRRRTSPSPPPEEIRVELPVSYWDYSHMCTTHPDRLNKWKTGAKILDTSTIVGPGQPSSNKDSFSLDDWKDLRDLATEAKNIYDDHNLSDAIHTLRAVIQECHHCLKIYPDPSVVFAAPLHKKKVVAPPPPAPPPVIREWYNDPSYSASRRSQGQQAMLFPLPSPPPEKEECPCVDLPTAFHTVLGTALLTFGCIIDSDPSLVLEGEPKTPTPYWLAAIDVFESGESLPIRTSGRVPKSMPEDWRMSASWGRTLVKLAAELLKRRKENPKLREPPAIPDYRNFKVPPPSLPTPFRTYTADEPDWPRASVFATISFLRPPFTRRLSLDTLTPDEIMTFAEDHLSRAIFYMPHPRNVPVKNNPSAPSPMHTSPTPSPPPDPALERSGPDRPQEIYTMASEVLLVAENSETPSGRLRWARWADGVVSQIKIEPNMKPQKFLDLRAKCNLTMGTAKMEELTANWDYPNVLDTEDAEDGREYFKNASMFFEQAIALIEDDIENTVEVEQDIDSKHRMESESDDDDDDGEESGNASVGLEIDLHRMKSLRSEALIELGNLTADFKAREELYAEAKRVGGRRIVLDDEQSYDGDQMETD
ncbi:hypothetical protein BYT27DRAFT_7129023 [Phlegmacium glaucopus]|nr:hypothetical protein BYT27DRAFT_7129023 [Phlegmacium glaucopus]